MPKEYSNRFKPKYCKAFKSWLRSQLNMTNDSIRLNLE